ncbi:helix-turn-helix transcriptional regulator [Rugamonas sp.]|uniref:helix-turn-helix domain-containing protein n=1 Tax=Rugamonas sp. TaxID=1926287 RepID=UPI0025E55431|nr:helix-turn-helix transcriptional regulator [Rugamonas sp.]
MHHLSSPAERQPHPVMKRLIYSTGSSYDVRRADVWMPYLQGRVEFTVTHAMPVQARADVRTPAEHLANIRAVLQPAIADLAELFDVSRQAIYKWLAADTRPDADKMPRLTELSRIADAFRHAGIARAGALLKMRALHGKSLFDLLKSNTDSSAAVAQLIAEATTMEQAYRDSGLALSSATPSGDWQSSVSIPGSVEE